MMLLDNGIFCEVSGCCKILLLLLHWRKLEGEGEARILLLHWRLAPGAGARLVLEPLLEQKKIRVLSWDIDAVVGIVEVC